MLLSIFNNLGQEIETLVSGLRSPGVYEELWNPLEQSSGVYFYKLNVNDYIQVRKMILMK